MAKRFSELISEIMPLVRDGDTSTPFIISRDSAYGDWLVYYPYPAENADSFLESQREHDPYAVMYNGADFSDGSFAFIHDKILCARLRTEYDVVPFGTVHGGEFRALINAVEDSIGSFSQKTIDYILEFDNPLRALYDLNPIPLYNRDNPDNEPYDADKADEFVECINAEVEQLRGEKAQATEHEAPGTSFAGMIDKIWSEVMVGGDEPLLIYRDADGGWHGDFTKNQYGETYEWVEDVVNADKAAFLAHGQDFASANKQDLYNEVLCQRLRNEYYNVTSYDMGAEHKKLYALLNFFEDNVKEFSPIVLDSLTLIGRPFTFLGDICPLNMATSHADWTYNKDLAPDAFDHITQQIEGPITIQQLTESELEDKAYLNKQTQRDVEAMLDSEEIPGKSKRVIDGHYTEKFSVALAGREVFLAVDEKEDAPYLVCTARWDNPLGVTEYFGGEVTADYVEAMREFVDRVDTLVGALEQERAALPTVQPTLTAADCIPGGLDDNLTGKVVVIKPDVLSPEYRTADHQLKIVQGGFGAEPNSRGNAVFCKDLYSDKETRFERYDIAGVIDPSKLPQWAKDKLAHLEALKEPPTNTHEVPKQPTQTKAAPTLLGEVREAVAIVEQRKSERGNQLAANKKLAESER